MDSEPGLIILQIDGLGRDVLTRTLRRRLMPFTRRLLRRRRHVLVPTRTGVPASTPAFQAGLFYGVPSPLPGFRWFEKESGRVRVMKNIPDISAALARLPQERGLMRGGATYCAFFSGGAERAYFTPGQSDPGFLNAALGPRALPVLLRNLLPALRILGLSVYELWLEALDYASALWRGTRRRGEGLFPFERVIANAILREACTLGALAEIRRSTPAIFVNFVGFDVMAHHRGPRSISAALALKAIDRQIRKIWRAARRASRPYELYILSDHGQTPTLPFERASGRSLRLAIVEHELAAHVAEVGTARYREVVHSVAVIGQLRQLQGILPWPLRSAAGLAARWMERRLDRLGEAEAAECVADLVVMATSGLAHLYFRRHPGRPDVEELEAAHPGLIGHLAGLQGVRAVVGRSRGGTVIRGPEGELLVGETVTLRGTDPLTGAGPTEMVARELAALLAQDQSGDLVLLAGKLERGRRLWRGPLYANFLDELGGHGGIEPPEQNTFLVVPPWRARVFPEGCRPSQIYEGLRRIRGLDRPGPGAAAGGAPAPRADVPG